MTHWPQTNCIITLDKEDCPYFITSTKWVVFSLAFVVSWLNMARQGVSLGGGLRCPTSSWMKTSKQPKKNNTSSFISEHLYNPDNSWKRTIIITLLDNLIVCQVSSGSLKTGRVLCKSDAIYFLFSQLFWFFIFCVNTVQLTPLCCSRLCGPAPSSSVVSCGSKAGGRLRGGRGGSVCETQMILTSNYNKRDLFLDCKLVFRGEMGDIFC